MPAVNQNQIMPVGSVAGPSLSTQASDARLAAAGAQMARDKAMAAGNKIPPAPASRPSPTLTAEQKQRVNMIRRQQSAPSMNQPPAPLANVLQMANRATSPSGPAGPGMAKGGKVKTYASGGTVRGGGCEMRGKTKGRML